MKKFAVSFLSLFILALFAESELKEYRFVRSAKSDGKKSETIAIKFDNELYRHTNNDYSNILILDSSNNKIPFAVRDTEIAGRREYAAKITDFRRNIKKNTAEIELTPEKEVSINTLEFDTDNKTFDKKISITFFDSNGKTVRKDDDLRLYRYGKLYGTPVIKFKTVKAKKLLIVIHNFVEQKALTVSTETVSKHDRKVEKNIRSEEFTIKKITVKNDTIGKKRMVNINLPHVNRADINSSNTLIIIDADNVPLEYLTVRADDKHYARPAKLDFVNSDGKTFATVGFPVSNDAEKIALHGRRADKIYLNILNGDNAPLKNIKLIWEAPDKIILAEKSNDNDLKIYYGGNAAKKSYDIEKYAGKLLFNEHSFYTLGSAEKCAFYAPELPKEKIVRYLMWGVLALAGVFLFAVIIKLLLLPENRSEE